MKQIAFATRVQEIVTPDDTVIGLAAAGSWITQELDEFSDLDLILVTREKVSGNRTRMLSYARQFGHLLSGFTGEHVGEPRVLICLYDDPLLHVDIKFLTLDEFHTRIETPAILLDKGGLLQKAIDCSAAIFPYPDLQWIEDRFWIWIHYALLKVGRGEYLEAFDFTGFVRMTVLGPLLHIRNGHLPRGLRKVETQLGKDDLSHLISTVPAYTKKSLLHSLKNAVFLYRDLRVSIFTDDIVLQTATETRVMQYFNEMD